MLAVKVVLTGDDFSPVYSTGKLEDAGLSGLQVEREARSSAEASPQLAPALATFGEVYTQIRAIPL